MKSSIWNIDFRETDGILSNLLELAIKAGQLAPSTHNSQPWEVRIKECSVELYDLDKNLKHSDPENKYKWISIGGFIENFSTVMDFHGYKTDVNIEKKYILLSAVPRISVDNNSLVTEINKRYSEKRIFRSNKIENNILNILSNVEGVSFISNDEEIIYQIAQLQYEASRKYKNNKYFARELSSWMNIRSKRPIGMNNKSSGLTKPKLIVGKIALKLKPQVLDKMSLKYKKLVECSNAVGMISVKYRNKNSYILSGRHLERLSLLASKFGLSVTPLAATIEDSESLEKLKSMQKLTENYPVILFRISDIKKPIHHTNRKSYNSILRS